MAAEARREARRKRILQNSDSRLKRILDSKSSEAVIDDESTGLLSGSSNFGKPFAEPNFVETLEDQSSREIQTESKERTDKTEANNQLGASARDVCQESDQPLRKRRREVQECDGNEGNSDRLKSRNPVKRERFTLDTWLRFVLNVILALLLVLLSTKYNIQQNFLVPWIALQVLMFFLPTGRQDVSSNWLTVLQVTLQLSGIPSHTTKGLNTAYAFVVLLLSDLPIFIFSVVFWFTISQKIAS